MSSLLHADAELKVVPCGRGGELLRNVVVEADADEDAQMPILARARRGRAQSDFYVEYCFSDKEGTVSTHSEGGGGGDESSSSKATTPRGRQPESECQFASSPDPERYNSPERMQHAVGYHPIMWVPGAFGAQPCAAMGAAGANMNGQVLAYPMLVDPSMWGCFVPCSPMRELQQPVQVGGAQPAAPVPGTQDTAGESSSSMSPATAQRRAPPSRRGEGTPPRSPKAECAAQRGGQRGGQQAVAVGGERRGDARDAATAVKKNVSKDPTANFAAAATRRASRMAAPTQQGRQSCFGERAAGAHPLGMDSVSEEAAGMNMVSPYFGSSSKVPSTYTTLMLRNLPNDYNRDMLVALLVREGFAGSFDFLYYPTDFKRWAGLGYSFVNFVNHAEALRAWHHFEGFAKWEVRTAKILEVTWAAPLQGLEVYVDRYRNSPVMHEGVPEVFKPMLFENGVQVPFPEPTKKVRLPRWKARCRGGVDDGTFSQA
mmetsp:Transcript_104830/g.301678  ORF Transcript_104830/g.301678 Transcript_104830/m.301678 type:complete len:486 (+) Transcript_104830:80-1537(+)